MNLTDFVKKYWHDAISLERKLFMPAVYLLAHAAINTELGTIKSDSLSHGFEVIIPVKISWFKIIFIKIKSWFIKEKEVIKEVIIVSEQEATDNVKHFFENVNYHDKFLYLQSVDRFCKYLYGNKPNEAAMTQKFKETASTISVLIHQ